ncbi:MAG: pesticidal protein Cry5Ba, partial [Pseudomonadota bacterium]
ELLILAFLFVTAPISANFIAKVSIHRGTCETPPSPPRDDTWSTLNTPDVYNEPNQQQDTQP